MVGRLACHVVLLAMAACGAGTPRSAVVPHSPLLDRDGATLDARVLAGRAPWTAFVFFAAHCHCLDAHDLRLRALAQTYAARGVRFVMIDSEAGATVNADAAEARRRGYPFPIVVDPGAALADALGADYATYTVVTDAAGHVRYRGGIDSDKIRLHDDASFFLRDALDDLLSGRPLRVPEGKALGCAISK
jgi:hypothetical protein